MTPSQRLYDDLRAALREVSLLNSTNAVLHWDEQTQMPPGGANHRAEQQALLARMGHERFTDPRIGDLLGQLEASDAVADPDGDAAVNVRETRRAYDRAVKLPGALVEELTRTTALAHHAWVDARKRSEHAIFEPWLGRILDLKRKQAACVAPPGVDFYDALLDEYEPGETAANLRAVFGALRGPLVDLVGRIVASGRAAPVDILARRYPVVSQEALGREAAQRLGFAFERGRLDVSVHPFSTTLGPGDTRITTRYAEDHFADAFFGVLHETGHALYEQGLPQEHYGTPLGEAASLGVHESQSRLWENLVGRSRAFWTYFFPRVKASFPTTLDDVDEERFVFAVNDVRPSLIRVEADEATYNLHILLRFEVEQAMLAGDLAPRDVPAAWNAKVKEYLGLTPPSDARGCLQDVHWSGGAVGYFPTYTLGNLYAAQLFEQARRDVGDLDAQFAAGEFGPLLAWLRENVHRHGQRHRPRDLVARVTGGAPSADALLRHLRAKAQEWYGV